jgi:hypothetical protein
MKQVQRFFFPEWLGLIVILGVKCEKKNYDNFRRRVLLLTSNSCINYIAANF